MQAANNVNIVIEKIKSTTENQSVFIINHNKCWTDNLFLAKYGELIVKFYNCSMHDLRIWFGSQVGLPWHKIGQPKHKSW